LSVSHNVATFKLEINRSFTPHKQQISRQTQVALIL